MQQLLCHQLTLSSRAGRTSHAHYHCPFPGVPTDALINTHPKGRNSVIYQICRRMIHLDEVGNVHGHLLNLSAVELLDLSHHADILGGHEVDRNTLPSETTSTTDSVDVVLTVGGEIVVDDQGNLLDIDTTGQKISGDQDTGGSRSELLHDQITLTLVHVAVHGGHGEVTRGELVGKPVNLPSGVAEDDSLCDGDSLIQIGEGVQLPILLLDGDVELLDTFEGELSLLDQDTDGIAHEFGGDLEHILGHGGGEEDNLGRLREELEDIVDLLSETTLDAC
jgi:hypothetical protein